MTDSDTRQSILSVKERKLPEFTLHFELNSHTEAICKEHGAFYLQIRATSRSIMVMQSNLSIDIRRVCGSQ